ncbi:hypothetical protein K431DRAFT_337000 [Polychaeton citri CBS 116435]|uniref:Peptidyl-tRNA hydrolase n=1 Tax=Polychaeton citri CBS 116435 TaxID=1314669 RepID=A0A9P4QB94_9PEZI|nr:hypothetical protein K431DRAFT_337000 [Polychaeton citri CBS 116435]
MRASTALFALPALASAADQVPLMDQVKGWFAKASSSISSAIPSVSVPSAGSIPDPIASGAAKVADLKVHQLTLNNWKEVLQPGAGSASPGVEEWLVYVTGGNKTCLGSCTHSEKAWNESVALMAVAPNPPNLALIDCETEPILCHSWAVGAPSVQHFLIPQPLPDQSQPGTTMHSININRTSVTATELANIHLKKTYLESDAYDGMFQPFDGQLAKYGIAVPVAYVVWGLNKVPSWMFMIGISFFSRTFMGRRPAGPPAGGARPQQ